MAYRLTKREFRKVAGLPSVRARCRLVARQVAGRTRSNLSAAGSAATVTVSEGTRANGRAYARVEHDDRFGEYGTSEVPRHRALGRAVKP